jgi:hypothetical protein
MISVPYSVELNDGMLFLGKSLSGDDFYRTVVDQFDQLYKEGEQSGRVMALCLHPFIINQPFRQKYLEKALEYVAGHAGVWLTTSDDIAAHYANTTHRSKSEVLTQVRFTGRRAKHQDNRSLHRSVKSISSRRSSAKAARLP